MITSPTSPRTTTLAESDPRQHAFCHSANTSEEEMEEKEHINQNLHISWNSVCFLLRTSRRIARKARPRERAHESWMVDDSVRFELLSPSTYQLYLALGVVARNSRTALRICYLGDVE